MKFLIHRTDKGETNFLSVFFGYQRLTICKLSTCHRLRKIRESKNIKIKDIIEKVMSRRVICSFRCHELGGVTALGPTLAHVRTPPVRRNTMRRNTIQYNTSGGASRTKVPNIPNIGKNEKLVTVIEVFSIHINSVFDSKTKFRPKSWHTTLKWWSINSPDNTANGVCP